MSNSASILSILACLALGVIVALAGSQGSITFNGLPSFALAASIGFILHWLIFIPSYIYQTEHYFDLIGSISYISIVLFTFLALNNLDIRSVLIGLFIMVWNSIHCLPCFTRMAVTYFDFSDFCLYSLN